MSGFTLPSATLLAQSILSGVFVGALYGLLGLGLSLSWGLLRVINLAHFGFAFLAAYLCYQLATLGMDPLLTLALIVPLFFAIGAGLHALMARFSITPFNSLLLTFGLTGIVEALIQTLWSADFRKLESAYGERHFKVVGLFVPLPELITLLLAVGLSLAAWAVLRHTDLGKALRASAEDSAIAAAFGIHQQRNALLLAGTCSALASVAGVLIGVSEAVTMAVTAPSWAPLVSFTLLIAILLLRPGRAA